jgi:hypothetical protein
MWNDRKEDGEGIKMDDDERIFGRESDVSLL